MIPQCCILLIFLTILILVDNKRIFFTCISLSLSFHFFKQISLYRLMFFYCSCQGFNFFFVLGQLRLQFSLIFLQNVNIFLFSFQFLRYKGVYFLKDIKQGKGTTLWKEMDSFNPFGTSFTKFGKVWPNLDKFYKFHRILTCLILSWQALSNKVKSGQFYNWNMVKTYM